MPFRKIVFWLHLVAGIISGLSIGIMCITGTALAFEKELIAWAERDARRVEIPFTGTPRLPLDELHRRFRAAQPDARPSNLVLQNDPRAAIAFTSGRTGGFQVNPYTGEVRQPKSTAMSRFMQTMNEWHRSLGFTSETNRTRGRLINGVCNIAFCLLAITGLYLWIPRSWSWRSLRPVVWFRQNSSGKARDWNWHNVIGLWSAPVLIVLTLTALPISFRWAGNLIYTLSGEASPESSGGLRPASSPTGMSVELTPPPLGSSPLPLETLIATAQKQFPNWQTMTVRIGVGGNPRGPRNVEPAGESAPRRVQPATLTIREGNTWPRTATSTLFLDPFSGTLLRVEGYAELGAARRVRTWTRFLHTGEALGKGGQFVAGLACLGGVFLVYTGFALAWRRFFGRRELIITRSSTRPENELVASR